MCSLNEIFKRLRYYFIILHHQIKKALKDKITMDQLPFDNLEQLCQVLKITFTGNTETIKQATELLDKMAEVNYLGFAKNIFEIIHIQKIEGIGTVFA